MLKRKGRLVIAGSGLLLIVLSFAIESLNIRSSESIVGEAEKRIENRLALCSRLLDSAREFPGEPIKNRLLNAFQEQRIGILIYQRDSLLFWNNSRFPVPLPKSFTDSIGIITLVNGHFLYLRDQHGVRTSVAINLLRTDYNIQNNYLVNEFREWTGIPLGIGISTAGKAASENPVMHAGKLLFSLKTEEAVFHDPGSDNLAFLVLTAGISLLLVYLLFVVNSKKPFYTALIVIAGFIVRTLMVVLKWPAFMYRSSLYDVHLFGNANSVYNGYIGDILLNSLCLLFLAAACNFSLPANSRERTATYRISLLSAIVLLFYYQFNQVLISLVGNSTLNFNFLSLFSVHWPAWIALGSLCLVALALFVALRKLLKLLYSINKAGFLVYFAIILVICVVHHLFSGTGVAAKNYWLLLAALPLYFIESRHGSPVALSLAGYIIVVAVSGSSFINHYINRNEKQELDVLSYRLGEMQDAILENEFMPLAKKIRSDPALKTLMALLPASRNEVASYLRQRYFTGYFDRYKTDISLFDRECNPMLPSSNPLLLNEGYFRDQIRYYSDSVQSGLYFLNDPQRNASYIGHIPLNGHNLYVMMERGHYEEWGSFPDLLLDASLQRHEKLKTFSYAVYRSGRLLNKYGDFSYPYFLPSRGAIASSGIPWLHRHFNPEENIDIIISSRKKTWNYYFTFNSYLLLFFSLIALSFYVMYYLLFTRRFSEASLTRRIQSIIILILLLSITVVGVTSGRLVKAQFEAGNRKDLVEKTSVIVSELSGRFRTGELFSEAHKELVSLELKEFARMFNTPVSLFSARGKLFNTSEPRLYELGLAAEVMNPSAYDVLMENRSSSEIVTEKAGGLSYTSLYTPLPGSDQTQMGYVNLPYFARQGDLADELSATIGAFINVYVILLLISVLAGLILSGYITRPLRIISQQIAGISLGRRNEQIEWKTNDEIGKLVSEYNSMLVKLEESAGMLARSERESAWREMAKQVAHEIKNPLTPMKLNLQYLQKMIRENPGDFREHFEKASEGIISQIDALAGIAGEFSSFARLQAAELKPVNLKEIISGSLMIFDNQGDISVISKLGEGTVMVMGDPDQCLRVFNNIFSNAIEALEGRPDPTIEIGLKREGEKIIIHVKDNGSGIDENTAKKLFTPNFTTKSAGSGLGLAIVKNIMEGFAGRVWFESEKGRGAIFYLEFLGA